MSAPRLSHRAWVALLLAALVASGLLAFRDYGMGWDEVLQQQLGHAVYDYVVHDEPALLASDDRYYGPVVEMPLAALERAFDFGELRETYFARHLATFLLFVLGAYWLHRLATLLHGDPRWGVLAAALLATSPRLYADAFLNGKDVPFMVFFTGAMLTLAALLRRPGWGTALRHGLLCALAIDTRVVGLLLLPITLGFGVLALATAAPAARPRIAGRWSLSLLAAGAFVVAFWPLLWSAPLTHLLEAIAQSARFPWDQPVLYLGAFQPATALPWHYVPIWILVTTPLPYLALAAIGIVATAVALVRAGRAGLRADPASLLPLVWLVGPWAVVVARDAVLYDGWRHLFFVYPALVLLAVAGARALVTLAGARLRTVVVGALILASAQATAAMVRLHPYQNVYFNGLDAPTRARERFELDYWGTSYREGLEHVLRRDGRERIRVWVANDPGMYNALLLPRAERERLVFVEAPAQAEYLLSNFRWHPADYPYPELYAVTAGGIKILAVYRGPAARR